MPKIDAKASIEKRRKSVINTAYFAGIHLLVLAQRRRDALEANRFDSSAGGVGTLQDKKKDRQKRDIFFTWCFYLYRFFGIMVNSMLALTLTIDHKMYR